MEKVKLMFIGHEKVTGLYINWLWHSFIFCKTV